MEGDLGINTGVINLDELLAATTGSATHDADRDSGHRPGVRRARASAVGDVFDALQMEIHVKVPNDLVVKGSDLRISNAPVGLGALNVTLGGDLWVSKTPWDRPRLTGPVNTVRGTMIWAAASTSCATAPAVRGPTSSTRFDIRAERLIQGVRTNVNHGTLHKPEVVLSSSPPLEQSDILALIVFNQSASQIGAGSRFRWPGGIRALGYAISRVITVRIVSRSLSVASLACIAPDSGAAAQVTVGQQVGQNLFVKVEQGIGDQTATNVVIEYQMGNWLLLETNVRQGATTLQPFQRVQGSGMDLIFFFSY